QAHLTRFPRCPSPISHDSSPGPYLTRFMPAPPRRRSKRVGRELDLEHSREPLARRPAESRNEVPVSSHRLDPELLRRGVRFGTRSVLGLDEAAVGILPQPQTHLARFPRCRQFEAGIV